jgi:hypothetical protein
MFETRRRDFITLLGGAAVALRDGIAHSVRQEGHRYRLRRRAIDSAPFSLLAAPQ